ncbi:MAG: DUF748 domain-containing protein [Dechloromonas sp.]|nr:DUF748 domain-containing protein [Dechloromonas sp.]
MSRALLHLPAVLRQFMARRFARWGLGLLAAVGGYALLGFVVLPWGIEAVLRSQATALGLQVQRVERIAVDPFALTLQIDDLALATASGQDQLGWAGLTVDAGWRSLTRGAWVVDAIELEAPFVRLQRQAGGQIELLDRLAAWQARDPQPPGPMPRFELAGLQLRDGQVDLDDQVRHRQHRLAAVHFSTSLVSSVPERRGQPVDVVLQGRFDGAAVALNGTVQPLAETPSGQLELTVDQLALAPWQGDLPPPLALKLQAGTLATQLQLRFGPDLASPRLQGSVQVQGLQVATTDGQPLLGWQQLTVELAPSQPFARQLAIGRVAVQGLTAMLAVDPAGLLNIQSLWRDDALAPVLATPAAPPWRWSVAAVTLADARVRWLDASRARPVAGELAQLQAQIGPFDSRLAAPFNVAEVAARLDFGRPLTVDRIRLQGLRIDLAERHIDLADFEQQGVRLNWQRLPRGGTRWLTPPRLTEKAISPASTAPESDKTAAAGWSVGLGRWRMTDLVAGLDEVSAGPAGHTVDAGKSQEMLRWQTLALSGLRAASAPPQVAIEQVTLSDFAGRLLLDAQGQLNATALAAAPAAEERPVPAQAPEAAGGPLPAIRIDEIRLAAGQVDFTDQFIQPNYSVTVGQLAGTVRGLSSAPGSLADLDVRGRYGEHAPVQITARLNPWQSLPQLDLTASVKAVDLTALSAYAGKYAGFGIAQGVLSMDVHYQLAAGQLQADNHLFVDQLTFGEPVASNQATSLPVQFAVALLKNSRGEIDLNLPIAGSLDDPQFSVSGLVFKVLGQVVMKAVTSPFSMLGALFGGGEDLSAVFFAPGEATLDGAALVRLQGLARALKERPALHLDLLGQADPAGDMPGLPAVRAVAVPKEASSAPGTEKKTPPPEPSPALIAEQLQQLAARRAATVRHWLQTQGQIEAGRLHVLPSSPAAETVARCVQFSLR